MLVGKAPKLVFLTPDPSTENTLEDQTAGCKQTHFGPSGVYLGWQKGPRTEARSAGSTLREALAKDLESSEAEAGWQRLRKVNPQGVRTEAW